MVDAALFSSANTEWGTPQLIFNQLNDIFNFDIDVAATPENAKCPVYYTEQDDALTQSWTDYGVTAWCNPPYGRTITPKWVKYGYEQAEKAGTVVMLLPSRTDTKWFHDYIYGHSAFIFLKGRLKFEPANNPAPFPSMLVAWGVYANRLYDFRSKYGKS